MVSPRFRHRSVIVCLAPMGCHVTTAVDDEQCLGMMTANIRGDDEGSITALISVRWMRRDGGCWSPETASMLVT